MSSLTDYQVLQRLGGGTFGTCSKVCLRGDRGKVFAWKEIDYRQFSESELRMLCQEVNLLRALKHPNVVAYQGRIVDMDTSRVFVLMEFCPNGDLSSLIAALARVARLQPDRLAPEAFVRRVAVQLLDALRYCHGAEAAAAASASSLGPVIHRDLKPANVLLDANWSVKLADFGLSRVLSSVQSLATSFVGSPMYMSPELLGDEGFTTPKSDVWALGCILHELMALTPPFSAQTETLLRLQILNGGHSRIPVVFSASLRCLATDMMRVDQAKRPTAAELLGRPELRTWVAEAAKPWAPTPQEPSTPSDVMVEEADSSLPTPSARLELLLLQGRLAERESRLLAEAAELQERRQRLDADTAVAEAAVKRSEERLTAWEARLARLNEALREKQRLLAAATDATAQGKEQLTRLGSAAGSEDSAAAGTRRRHTALPGQARRLAMQSINLSPIVASGGDDTGRRKLPQQQPLHGKYTSPAAAADAEEADEIRNGRRRRQAQGTYGPMLRKQASTGAGQRQQELPPEPEGGCRRRELRPRKPASVAK